MAHGTTQVHKTAFSEHNNLSSVYIVNVNLRFDGVLGAAIVTV
jgi:hypothetical protein